MKEATGDPIVVVDIAAYREWKSWPEERRQLYLHNAFCSACFHESGATSFAPNYTIRKGYSGLVVEGYCVRCGRPITRCCD